MVDEIPVRPAATVMLLRDTVEGLEVFMLRRTNAAAFAGGMYVFPGGRVDDQDGEGDAAFAMAAIRECFEECGVLLARDAEGNDITDGHPALAHRHGVHDGSIDVRELASEHGLTLSLDDLVWMSHWITPKGEAARRFDTRFFMVASPSGQHSQHDDSETVASMWVRPVEALAAGGRGELQLMPPTIANLQFLAEHADVESAMTAARLVGTPACILPKIRWVDGRLAGIAMPGDEDYDSLP
jgi:8-oxo-dGTP pyrophosphatase MutT (NUDIX family)